MNPQLKKDLHKYNRLKLNARNELDKNRLEAALDYVYVASTYAWNVNVGILCDDELEDLLSIISGRLRERLKDSSGKQDIGDGTKSIVHVASHLRDTGGHSEVLRQWMEILAGLVDVQYLYITNVRNRPTKYSRLDDFKKKGVRIRELSYSDSYVNRVAELSKHFENDSPDIAIVYISPNDVVAITTLLALRNKPYVIFFNHADHVYWLGKSIIDVLVEFRSISAKYSTTYRRIDKDRISVIPLSTNIKPRKVPKTQYKVPEDSTLSISVGSFGKVLGTQEFDYFRTIERILVRFPNYYHILITDYPKAIKRKYVPDNPDVRERLIVAGPFNNLEDIYGTADFLIETFPFPGGMVRVEAMACGLPIVSFRNKNCDIISELDALPADYAFRFSTEDEVIKHSSEFISHPELRKRVGTGLYNYYKRTMSPQKVRSLWSTILEKRPCAGEHRTACVQRRETGELNTDHIYSWRDHFPMCSFSLNFPINEILLNQSTVKESEFSFRDKFKFCGGDIRNFARWGYKTSKRHIKRIQKLP